MCCIVSSLLLFAPRFAILIWWLMDSARFNLAFSTKVWPIQISWPFWIWPLIGAIFVPWTTLAYLVVSPGGVVGLDWVWLAVGLVLDLASHSGGYRNRDRVRRRRR